MGLKLEMPAALILQIVKSSSQMRARTAYHIPCPKSTNSGNTNIRSIDYQQTTIIERLRQKKTNTIPQAGGSKVF